MVLALLGGVPAIAAAANTLQLTIPGLTDTSATVTVTDTTYGAVYNVTYSGGTWSGLIGSASDSYLLQAVSQSVYENTYDSLLVPSAGTVTGSTYALTTPLVVPAAAPTAGSVAFTGVTATSATVTATVYAGVYTNPVANAGLVLVTTSAGASLTAGANGMTVAGAVYGSTSAGGTLAATLTGDSGSTVAVAVYYNGAQIATGQTTLLASGGVASGSSSSSSGSGASSGQSIGPNGGTLTTPDGTFTMTVPAGAIGSGLTLGVTAAPSPPSGAPQPPFTTIASQYYTLAGAALSQPLAAQIGYHAAWLDGLSPNRLAVWALVGGVWKYVPTALNAAQGTVSFYVSGPTTLVVLFNSTRLTDVASGFWAEPALDTLLGADVVNGYPDGSFQPAQPVTRAEFIKMMALSLGLTPSTTPPPFTDVAPGDWFAGWVGAAVQAGLIQGVAPGTFAPDQALTRDQMAVLLARALKLQGGSAPTFSDASQVQGWAEASLAADIRARLLTGYPDGTFRPLDPSSRAESAQVLAALIHYLAP